MPLRTTLDTTSAIYPQCHRITALYGKEIALPSEHKSFWSIYEDDTLSIAMNSNIIEAARNSEHRRFEYTLSITQRGIRVYEEQDGVPVIYEPGLWEEQLKRLAYRE